MFDLEKTTEMNHLYDFYAPLLTEKQRSLWELYFFDDWSLAEIAEHQGVSRQAVFESLKRAQRALLAFEDKLALWKKHQQRLKWVEEFLTELQSEPTLQQKVESRLRQWLEID
jgi:predicted DNA-binding protein YlxM (UPF0122 family)